MPSSTPAASRVFLHRLGLGVDVLQVLAVVDPQSSNRMLEFSCSQQPAGDAEAAEDLQHLRRAGGVAQLAFAQQLVVNLALFGNPQAVRHLDHRDAVEEGLVVLVVLELLPFRLVRVGEDDALEGEGAEGLGAQVVAFLGCGQQGMQHLDGRLEHLDEFEQSLGRAVEPAGDSSRRPGRSGRNAPACGCPPCRPGKRCPGCSRRPARSWRSRSGAAWRASGGRR